MSFYLCALLALAGIQFSGKQATYKESEIELTDQIEITHALGSMTAKHASILLTEAKTPAKAVIDEQIRFCSQSDHQILADHLELNFINHEATFRALDHPIICTYSDPLEETYTLTSKVLTLLFSQEASRGVQEIQACDDVHLLFAGGLEMHTEKLTIYEDHLTTDPMCPTTITLQEFGHLTATTPIRLDFQTKSMNPLQMESQGEVAIDFNEASPMGQGRFTSIEGFTYDCTAKCFTTRPASKQTRFTSNLLDISADQAMMHLNAKALKEMSFTGGVKLKTIDNDSLVSRGLADAITYDNLTQEITLKALDGKKVLFWSEDDRIQMSSDAIVLHTTPNGKYSVESLGETSLSFHLEDKQRIMEALRHDTSLFSQKHR